MESSPPSFISERQVYWGFHLLLIFFLLATVVMALHGSIISCPQWSKEILSDWARAEPRLIAQKWLVQGSAWKLSGALHIQAAYKHSLRLKWSKLSRLLATYLFPFPTHVYPSFSISSHTTHAHACTHQHTHKGTLFFKAKLIPIASPREWILNFSFSQCDSRLISFGVLKRQ